MTAAELNRIAAQYQGDGYETVVRPAPDDLPEFLRSQSIDILARKAGESVIVAARKHRSELRDGRLAYLSAEVNSRPGWRMDLVVTNDEESAPEFPAGAREPVDEEIRARAQTAERLLRDRNLAESLIVAWSALEAALRSAARRLSIPLTSESPQFVLETMIVEGAISRELYDELSRSRPLRDAAARGLTIAALTPQSVALVIAAVNEVLSLEFALSES